MSILWALAAFAGAMAVLSTVVSVVVEAMHKVFGLRRGGLEDMLRAMYELERSRHGAHYAEHDAGKAPAHAFARQVTRSPVLHTWGWSLKQTPVLSWIFSSRLERLSPVQLAEQVANTPMGDRIAALPPDRQRAELSALVYQFNRLGEAQSAYFRARAMVMSVLVAISFAFVANVDALHMFGTYLRDQTAAAALVGRVEGHEFDRLLADTRSSVDKLNAKLDASQAANGDDLKGDVEKLRTAIDAVSSDSRSLADMGIPIGPRMYPYCQPAPETTVEGGEALIDPRCRTRQEGHYLLSLGWPLIEVVPSLTPEHENKRGIWIPRWALSFDAAIWLFGVVGAAGLLGLGAPFWFDLFRRLAFLLAALRGGQAPAADAKAQRNAAPEPPPSRPAPPASRDPRREDADALHKGFTMARGPSDADALDPPRGRRIGPSTQPPPADAAAGQDIRRLRD